MSGLFGTDGVRGRANRHPMTAEVALRLAMAAGRHFRRGAHRHRVIVGKDTRRANYMLETALTSGLSSMGMDVFQLGPMPTAGVATFTRSLRADLGIMITASHNHHHDIGIKFIDADGYKLSDEVQAALAARMDEDVASHLSPPEDMGHVQQLEDGRARYIEFAKATFPRRLRLDGMKVVVDCANGAAYDVAPRVFWELGAEVVSLGVDPNGFNINLDCGSTSPEAAQKKVLEVDANLGVVLDGDGDRLLLIDETGKTADGDHILAMVAAHLHSRNRISGGAVVGTVMSNLGLERHLQSFGLSLDRTRVGDRYVAERMREQGCNLGGEPSGHVVLSDYVTTGDAVVAALQVMADMVYSGRSASDLCRQYQPVPQVIRSVPSAGPDRLALPGVRQAVTSAEERLGQSGRIVVRMSGTEPNARVMAEGEDVDLLHALVDSVCDEIAKAA